jgi:formylglycine-generating enzyme required for sulfatase activity
LVASCVIREYFLLVGCGSEPRDYSLVEDVSAHTGDALNAVDTSVADSAADAQFDVDVRQVDTESGVDTGDASGESEMDSVLESDADIEVIVDTGGNIRPDSHTNTSPVILCSDLNCSAVGRECAESNQGFDAQCMGCLAGFIADRGDCVPAECIGDEDCTPVGSVDEWSGCGGYADVCANEGTRTRMVNRGSCVRGRCQVARQEEVEPCPEMRLTEGVACTNDGDIGACTSGVCFVDPLAPQLGRLGETCEADEECRAGLWCSTASENRRCSPVHFDGTPERMAFVFVPAGSSEHGHERGRDYERPFTSTLTRDYFVGRTEVTQGQWLAASGGVNPSCFQERTGSSCTASNANNWGPVEQINWYSALAYANWLSSQNGLQECYTLVGCVDPDTGWQDGTHNWCTGAAFIGLDCTGYRLLTEAEWERAARGGTTTVYFWGDATDLMSVDPFHWYAGNSERRTQSVGGKFSNPYGLFDMNGNLSEFVWDVVRGGYGYLLNPAGSATDYFVSDPGPSLNPWRGVRGGDWSRSVTPSGTRSGIVHTSRSNTIGFRLARTVP